MNMASNLRPTRLPTALLILMALVVGLAIAGWLIAGRATQAPSLVPAAYSMPTNPEIEARWGVRISQVAVTASGGLVDLRYVALDSDKAHAMFSSLATTPRIDLPGRDVSIALEAPVHHKSAIEPGRTYFVLYVNRKGALHKGDTVTVTIGDLRLEHVPIR